MVSVRLRLEIPAPTRKLMEPLPESAEEAVILALGEVIPRCIKEVDIHGKTYKVYASQRTRTPLGVGFRLLGASNDFSDSTTISLVVDIVQEAGEEPSK